MAGRVSRQRNPPLTHGESVAPTNLIRAASSLMPIKIATSPTISRFWLIKSG
jgi:hypothetical protein